MASGCFGAEVGEVDEGSLAMCVDKSLPGLAAVWLGVIAYYLTGCQLVP